jgi:surface antigen
MLSLILGDISPVQVPTVQILTEQRIVVEAPPEIIEERELTIEEKIAQNYYGCNTDTHWISAENATCLLKQSRSTNTRVRSQNTPRAPQNGSGAPSGYYKWGWCTYGAWSLTGWAGPWQDAKFWASNAQRDGHIVSGVPIVGSIFVDRSGVYGHVGVVIGVNSDSITVRDMNFVGFGQWSTRTISSSGLLFIYPIGV